MTKEINVDKIILEYSEKFLEKYDWISFEGTFICTSRPKELENGKWSIELSLCPESKVIFKDNEYLKEIYPERK